LISPETGVEEGYKPTPQKDAAGRVHMKHPRLRSEKGDEISVRLDRRGNFLKSSENIFTLKSFLEANPIALSYVKATVT
jgi:hypothetical protein